MRASDEDRQRIIDTLQQHTAAGRLSLDEFSDRIGTVYAAKTLSELHLATHDLPVTRPAERDDHGRQLIVAFVVALIALVLLGTAYTLLAH